MGHTLVVGGQPDHHSQLSTSWSDHGREITAGDAENVIDATPSVVYRAPSIGSGEFYFKKNWLNDHGLNPRRGICGITHNLLDIDAKVRVVLSDILGGGGPSFVNPDSTVDQVNTTSTYQDVDQDPYGTISTWATPTTNTSDWAIEVGFSNTDTLQTSVADSQHILVLARYNGPADDGRQIEVYVKESSTIRDRKTMNILSEADQDTYIFLVPVDPTDYSDQTLDGMSVRVEMTSASGPLFWEVGSIQWVKVTDNPQVDTGWIDVESTPSDLFYMDSDVQGSSILPYLDSSGNVSNVAFGLSTSEALDTNIFFQWNEQNGGVVSRKPRIFSNSDGALTSWRPEIGVIAEGPAYGTDQAPIEDISFGSKPNSLLLESKGGNIWTVRKEPRRTLTAKMKAIPGTDFIDSVYSVLRRADRNLPLCVAADPGSSSPNIRSAASIYGRLTGLSSRPLSQGNSSRAFDVTMSFEEVV